MPIYNTPIDSIILHEEDVVKMYEQCRNAREQGALAFLWLIGPRPSEVIGLKRQDIQIRDNGIIVNIGTRKRRHDGTFKMHERTLLFERNKDRPNIWIERAIKYTSLIKSPEEPLFPISIRTLQRQITTISKAALGKELSVYHLRHGVFSLMGRTHGITELCHMKGVDDPASVKAYLHAVPFVVKEKDLERTRFNEGLEKS